MFSYLNPLPQLPSYKGPFKVGSCEYEIPVSEIPSTTAIPDSSITTIKFRVYYPTTDSASSKVSIPWLPTPQKEWNKAYASFLGFSDRSCNFVANVPSMLNHPTLPAVHNAPLREVQSGQHFPVAIFSHGLGGNYNAYSSFVGSLASCGVIVFAPEHRDQSAPVSFIRASPDSKTGRPVLYRKVSHSPRVDVLNARNEMLRVRLWELEKLYTTVAALNRGQNFTNYAAEAKDTFPNLKNQLDLSTGKLTWAGHSFGAATVVQFVKSVYYRQFAPPKEHSKDENGREQWDWKPIYTPADNDELSRQITPESPMVLLDLWTMPLTSKTTKWLWDKPLPCYDRKTNATATSNVVSIMSSQFYKWSELLNRTKALLSSNPAETYERLMAATGKQGENDLEKADAEGPAPQLALDPITKLETSKTRGLALNGSNTTETNAPQTKSVYQIVEDSETHSGSSTRSPSPTPSDSDLFTNQPAASSRSASSSQSSLPSLPESAVDKSISSTQPLLYLVPTSAHLSQSDFGLLFPNVTKWLLKTIDPQLIMDLNVRAALATMRGVGLDVQSLKEVKTEDQILAKGAGGLSKDVWQAIDFNA